MCMKKTMQFIYCSIKYAQNIYGRRCGSRVQVAGDSNGIKFGYTE